jgi:hypothetical protein
MIKVIDPPPPPPNKISHLQMKREDEVIRNVILIGTFSIYNELLPVIKQYVIKKCSLSFIIRKPLHRRLIFFFQKDISIYFSLLTSLSNHSLDDFSNDLSIS